MLGDAGEDIGEPGLRIDVVRFCHGDEGVHDRGSVTAAVGSGEQPCSSSGSQTAQGAFFAHPGFQFGHRRGALLLSDLHPQKSS